MLQSRDLLRVFWCALAVLASLPAVCAATATNGDVPIGNADELPMADVPSAEGVIELRSAGQPTESDQQEWEEQAAPDGLLNNPVYDEWTTQWLPVGLIYHPYMAGAHQP